MLASLHRVLLLAALLLATSCSATPISIPGQSDAGIPTSDSGVGPADAAADSGPTADGAAFPDMAAPDGGVGDAIGDAIGDAPMGDGASDAIGDAPTGDGDAPGPLSDALQTLPGVDQ